MTYQKTQWQNGVTPINEDNLNHGETQYDEAMKDVRAGFAPLTAQQLALSAGAWSADKVAASSFARANYDDAAASNEVWGGLNNWTYTSGKLTVGGGKLYAADALGGSAYGAVRTQAFGAVTRMVLKTTVTIPASGTEYGDTIIGVTDEVGKVPTGGGARVKGITFRGQDLSIGVWNLGRDTTSPILGNYVPGATYYVTLTVDPTTVHVSVMRSDQGFTVATWIDRTGFTINSPYVFNNDNRGASGRLIGQLGFVTALSSLKTRAGLEDVAPWWPIITDNGAYRLHIAMPASYDPRKPSPLVIAFHGHGTNAANYGTGNNNGTDMLNAFTAAGFIVVSASLNSNLTTWGSDAGLAVYEYAYRYVKSFLAFSGVVFQANSMGGIESLLTLARNRIPCDAWIATVPTVSLKNNYARYGSAIAASYGVAADASDYDAKTAGHDPQLMPATAFRGVPMMVVMATDDTSVIPDQNWNLVEDAMKANARAYSRINVTGGHTSDALGDQAPAMVSFATRFVGDTLS